jgi:protein-S-isoprenylcysteine O-methyltransferase Ste14
MSKPHSSLSPTTNILLIFAWAAAACAFLFFIEPRCPVILAVVGAILGAIGGIMQHLSLTQATDGFSAAASLLEVRSALKATPWGTRYIRFLYFSKFVLIGLAFLLVRQPLLGIFFGYLAGYFSLMFVREVVTLRDAFFLHRLSSNPLRNEPNVA